MQYTWMPATGSDVPDIVNMAEQHFQTEIDTIFAPEPITYSRNITHAVINQFYQPKSELVRIARDDTGRMVAYTWARIECTHWSDDRMVMVQMAHTDLALPVRDRIRLVLGMMAEWEIFARDADISVVCSTTVRRDQSGFLRLHKRLGYDVRGSFAYKKLDLTQATPAN
jgi:hypothetical protein